MITKLLKRKKVYVFLLTFILIAAAIFSIIYFSSNSERDDKDINISTSNLSKENIKIDKKDIKIYVGSYPSNMVISQEAKDNPSLLTGKDAGKYIIKNDNLSEQYVAERKEFLTSLSKTRNKDVFEAVAVLNKYCTVDDIKTFCEAENLKIVGIYFWIPGESGRIRLVIENNNIESAINNHFEEFKKQENVDPQMKADYERMMSGNYGIFSIVINDTAQKLENLKGNSLVKFIDVKYNPDAENVAKMSGKRFQYVEIPSKPDNAH